MRIPKLGVGETVMLIEDRTVKITEIEIWTYSVLVMVRSQHRYWQLSKLGLQQ